MNPRTCSKICLLLIVCLLFIGGCAKKTTNNSNTEEPRIKLPKEVGLKINKTSYQQGETIKATASNGLDSSIHINGWGKSWLVFQNVDDKWDIIMSGSTKTLPQCICKDAPTGKCPHYSPPIERFEEIKSQEIATWSWDQKILEKTDAGCSNWVDVQAGQYKIEFRYFTTLDPNERQWQIVFSNEFTIQ